MIWEAFFFIPMEHMTLNEKRLNFFRAMFMGDLTVLLLLILER